MIAIARSDDTPGADQGPEVFGESGGTDSTLRTKVGGRLGIGGESANDALIDGDGWSGAPGLFGDDFEGQSLAAFDQSQVLFRNGRRGTVLNRQRDAILIVPAQVQVGIPPGVELG